MREGTTIKGLEQGRAAFAYDCALAGNKLSKNKEYKQYVKKVPMLIKTNGLGATLAFIKSKKEESYQLIYNQLKEWLINDDKNLINLTQEDDLVAKVISLESEQYRAVTIEILAFFSWLRRFAEGLIKGE